MMKKFIVFLLYVYLPVLSSAQTDSLKAVFTKTCDILRTYSFSSDTEATKAFYGNNSLLIGIKYQTKTIKLRVENGYFIFYFNDNGSEFDSPRYYQSGIYILKVPINALRIYFVPGVNLSSIRFTCNNGMTLSHRGKTKNYTEYQIFGEQSPSMLLYDSLTTLQESLINERYFGELSHTNSPSVDIKTAYANVVKTLKEYRFKSEDTWYVGNTKSITLKLQGGCFVFTINDIGISYDPNYSFGRDGIKTVKIPLLSASFYQPYNEGKLNLCSTDDNVEITWRGRKEIISHYSIEGTESTVMKLQQELEVLLSLAIEENFMGTLGGITKHRKATTKHSSSTLTKGKTTTRSQQRQRNRVAFGI